MPAAQPPAVLLGRSQPAALAELTRRYGSCRHWHLSAASLRLREPGWQLPNLSSPLLHCRLAPPPLPCRFQREGVRFMVEKGGRALLADEMGLGKTVGGWLGSTAQTAMLGVVFSLHKGRSKLGSRRRVATATSVAPIVWLLAPLGAGASPVRGGLLWAG